MATFGLLLAAVDQVDQGARDDDRREDRGQDAQAMHHGEAAHRAGAEDEQRQAGDQGRDVGVENGAEGAFVTFGMAACGGMTGVSAVPRGPAR